MSDEYEIFEYLESEYRIEKKNRRRRIREMDNPFEMNEREFINQYRYIHTNVNIKKIFILFFFTQNYYPYIYILTIIFRLSKDLVYTLCEDLEPYMRTNPQKSTDLSIETKVNIFIICDWYQNNENLGKAKYGSSYIYRY